MNIIEQASVLMNLISTVTVGYNEGRENARRKDIDDITKHFDKAIKELDTCKKLVEGWGNGNVRQRRM